MRRVLVFDYISEDGKHIKRPAYEGVFHEWGMDCEELQDGVGNYSVAIVEDLETGKVALVIPDNMRFMADDEPPFVKPEC